MRELFNFFIRNSKWFVFAIYLIVSVILLVNNNPIQHSVYLTSANAVSSSVYNLSNNISGYLNLRENNEDLNRRNAELLARVSQLELLVDELSGRLMLDSLDLPEVLKPYDFITAHVIKNSVYKPHNYLTINKGELAGIRPEMGVIDQNGVVGVVNVVGKNSARVISLLNPHFRLSCKIKGNESFGSLVWDGKDPRYAILEELPRHTIYHAGDTVVTSGYSAVFPSGIPVGIVEPNSKSGNDNLFALKIRLLSDFTTIDNVQVVTNYMAEEIQRLEEAEKKLDETTK